jgi:hypothetical protein
MSKIDELAELITPPMQPGFRQFVQTGEAPDDFLAYLERDPAAQQAVERAFDAQAEALGGLANAIHEGSQVDVVQHEHTVDSAQLAHLLEQVAALPEESRGGLLAGVVSDVTRKAGPEGAVRARSALSELQQAFYSSVK